MIALSLAFLAVCLFGAYAYGSAVVLALAERAPVWAPARRTPRDARLAANSAALRLFWVCTIWFVVQGLIEFRDLLGQPDGWVELVGLVFSYSFPPLIMHVVLFETHPEGVEPAAVWRRILTPMYFVSAALIAYVPAAILRFVPRVPELGPFIGLTIGGGFLVCSLYCMALIVTRQRPEPTPDQANMRRTMIGLFVMMVGLIVTLVVLRDRQILIEVLDRIARGIPVAFLIVSVYFENRFEFYDLVVKRGALLVLSVAVAGVFLAVALPWLDQLPTGLARPWLYAVALVPVVMLMPWLHAQLGRWLDRLWFGREFTPVEAVKHVLAAMQPATDEASLVNAAEGRLQELFGTRIHILLDEAAAPAGTGVEAQVSTVSPVTHSPVRFAVVREPGTRQLLSEDVALLRTLAGVFGFMLENVRLQRKRQEQEAVTQALRLQSSRSELKALRAQINPHFLFNALNAIASLIHTDPARADAAVEQLAEVFRYTLRRSDSDWAPLDQELAFARAYLDVEQARFGRRLVFSVHTDPGAREVQVPSMLLQTLVENAVKHGISQLRTPGRIEVRAALGNGRVDLEVRDTGPGPAGAGDRRPRPEGESFGLRSVRDRLQGHFGDRAALTLDRDETAGETIARITMPRVEAPA